MKKLLLVLADLAALYASLVITLTIRYGQDMRTQLDIHLAPFMFIFAIWILAFYIVNLYDISNVKNNIEFYSDQFRAVILAGILSIIAFYLIPFFGITPKRNLLIFIVVFSMLGIMMRLLANNFIERGYKKPLLIVGVNPQVAELANFINTNPQLGYELRYIVDTNHNPPLIPRPETGNFAIVQGLNQAKEIIDQEKVNTVVISPEAYQEPEIIDMFYKSLSRKVTFRNLSSFYESVASRIPLGAINQIWFLENLSEGSKKTYETTKNIFDKIFAIILGIITLLILPLIALVIKLDSPGPIFYRQRRLGQIGKTFEIIKFRTMRDNAEKETGAVWATENDPRVTKIGKFLRKSRIDELPQLWNILKSEMSFVGPRAERPEFYDSLRSNVPFYEERYLIKPGLTGWAQIHFRYGSSISDSAEKLQYDLYYIKNRSLLLDLGVILKTINIALRQAGR